MQRKSTTKKRPARASPEQRLSNSQRTTWPIAWPWVSLGMRQQGARAEPDNTAALLFR